MTHTADAFQDEPIGEHQPSPEEIAQGVAWVKNHQSPDATRPEPELSGTVVPEAPAEQTAPFIPPWLGGEDTGPQAAVTVVTVVQPVAVPPHPGFRGGHSCTCHFCQPPSTPPRHPYALFGVPWTDDSGTERQGIGIQPCAGCGTVYADEPAAGGDHLLGQTVRAAQLAGWKGDALRAWRCPECHGKHQAEMDAVPRWDAEGPGSAAYEERLKGHLDFLADFDKRMHAAGFAMPGSTVGDEMRLRTADAMAGFAISETEASALAVTAVMERRAALWARSSASRQSTSPGVGGGTARSAP